MNDSDRELLRLVVGAVRVIQRHLLCDEKMRVGASNLPIDQIDGFKQQITDMLAVLAREPSGGMGDCTALLDRIYHARVEGSRLRRRE